MVHSSTASSAQPSLGVFVPSNNVSIRIDDLPKKNCFFPASSFFVFDCTVFSHKLEVEWIMRFQHSRKKKIRYKHVALRRLLTNVRWMVPVYDVSSGKSGKHDS